MSQHKTRKETQSLAGRLVACLLMAILAMPGYADENFEEDCKLDLIEKSFTAASPDEKDVKALQDQLIAGKFLQGEASGALDQNTYQALHEFCRQIGPLEEDVPTTDPEDPGAELAEFLIEKAGEIKPAKAVCEVEPIQQRFAGLPRNEILQIQQLMRAGGFLTDWADGEYGPETERALVRLCGYLVNTNLPEGIGSGVQPAADVMAGVLTRDAEKLSMQLRQQTSRIALQAADSSASPPVAECGCSRDFEARVYGFLPYWLADGSPLGVDFSMLDRIGFYGLQLDGFGVEAQALAIDRDGEIRPQALWSTGSGSESDIARFINAANRHRVEVDITYYTSDWMNWKSGPESQIDDAVDAIVKSFGQEFSDTSDDDEIGANLLGLLRKLLPFVEDKSSVRADGINLYFDGYVDAQHAARLREIVTAVGQRLPEARLNVMLGLKWSGDGKITDGDDNSVQLFAELGEILKDESAVKVENLLVMLPRNTMSAGSNTSRAKKLLRRVIEDAFDGQGQLRRTVLRKTVPTVVTFDDPDQPKNYFGTGKSQFGDDLIYLQDNFAGVGLWPLPLIAAPASEESGEDAAETAADPPNDGVEIGASLLAQYEIKADWRKQEDWQEVDRLAEALCKFACPNRWLFRLVFDFLLAALVIYGLLALRFCRLREFYENRFPIFVAYGFVTAMVFTVSLICDPYWNEISQQVLIGLVLVLVGFLGFRYIRKSMQPRHP